MRTSRVALLLAGALLVAAEVLSLSLLLKSVGESQTRRNSEATNRAMILLPRIAEWVRSTGGAGESTNAAWLDPFESLAVEDLPSADLEAATRRQVELGEWVATTRLGERKITVLGSMNSEKGPVLLRLTEDSQDTTRLAADRIQMVQHIFILMTALAGLALAAVGRESAPGEANSPALLAYEEAMARLRVRDDERLAASDREKDQLVSTLKNRETMARAGELTAGIVHEVRNSLGTIAAQARLAEKSTDERVSKSGTAITEEVRTLQSVLVSFLDFIRTEKLQYGEFDLSKLVARVTAREGASHHALIETRGEPTIVRGDEDLLERAIENVIRNACQASQGMAVTVSFGADATSAFVMVNDQGSGIVDVSRALRPFESDRAGGLGLGLPLALKILALHRGTLDLAPGSGGVGTLAVCRWPKSPTDATTGNAADD